MRRSFAMMSFTLVLSGLCAVRTAGGQQAATAGPQVVTVGRGDVDVKPDRARIELTVETRASTATSASSENGRRQRAVLDTLQRMGIADAQIRTASLQVTPEIVYPGQGQPPKVTGYVARNSVRIEVLRLEQTGSIVDAALARGATEVSGLQFYSSRNADVRREALAKAVESARADAEAMARAAGYELGSVLEMSSGASYDGPIMLSADVLRPRAAMAMGAPAPVSPGEIKISESVTVRWVLRRP